MYSADRKQRPTSPGRPLGYAADRPQSSGHSKSPSRNKTPEAGHYRNDSSEARTMAWQPGMSAIGNMGHGRQQSITPEQFVQQRAAVATPLYAHQRQPSGNTLGRNTPTPPLVRNKSSDFLVQQGQGHSRHSSADLLQRPNSRGASSALGPSGNGDIPSSLSAREQEHIARVTGQPLINMAQNNRNSSSSAGLVGAIEAREREKQQMKQGINSQAVQHAIAQRHQQAAYQQYPEQNQDYRTPQSQYGATGQYPQAQYPGQPDQHSWVSPAANVYAQGGFPSPTSVYPGSPEPQQYTPAPMPYSAPQQNYTRPQHQGGQGRGQAGRQY